MCHMRSVSSVWKTLFKLSEEQFKEPKQVYSDVRCFSDNYPNFCTRELHKRILCSRFYASLSFLRKCLTTHLFQNLIEKKRSIKTFTFVFLDSPSKKKVIQRIIINVIITFNNGVEVMCSGKSMNDIYMYLLIFPFQRLHYVLHF